MAEPTSPASQPDPDSNSSKKDGRLDSWGEIAAYLGRDIRTVQRWEDDFGLPVKRLGTAKQGRVFAYTAELDRWMEERTKFDKPKRIPPSESVAPSPVAPEEIKIDPSSADSPLPSQDNDKNEENNSNWRGSAWMAGVAVIMVVAAVALAYSVLTPNNNPRNVVEIQKSQLFVRPFDNLNRETEEASFVRGLTFDLIAQLGKADPQSIVVFAPTASIENAKKTIPELRKDLGAEYVLEGSAQRSGDQLRIDATLVNAENQKTVWSNGYTTDLKNVLKSQDDVVRDVVGEIRVWMTGNGKSVSQQAASAKSGATSQDDYPFPKWNPDTPKNNAGSRGPVDPEAYRDYIRGGLYWMDRDILRSQAAYEKALEISPDFAPAQAGLAMVLLVSGQSPNDIGKAGESVPKARDLAQKALEKDPTLAEAYCVLANIAQFYEYDPKKAEEFYKLAVKVEPSSVTSHEWFGYYYLVHNRMPEAEMELNLALQLDPAAPLINAQAAEIKYYRRDYDGALALTEKILRDYPNFPYALIWKGSALRENRQYPEALKVFRLLRQVSDNAPASIGLEGHCLGLMGNKKGAMADLQELENLGRHRYVPAVYMSGVYVGMGDIPPAVNKLKEAYDERYERLVYLNVDPVADPLRGNAEFVKLMGMVGLN
jgi:TolB-like protein/Tfp pilus assembly protein PilF